MLFWHRYYCNLGLLVHCQHLSWIVPKLEGCQSLFWSWGIRHSMYSASQYELTSLNGYMIWWDLYTAITLSCKFHILSTGQFGTYQYVCIPVHCNFQWFEKKKKDHCALVCCAVFDFATNIFLIMSICFVDNVGQMHPYIGSVTTSSQSLLTDSYKNNLQWSSSVENMWHRVLYCTAHFCGDVSSSAFISSFTW